THRAGPFVVWLLQAREIGIGRSAEAQDLEQQLAKATGINENGQYPIKRTGIDAGTPRFEQTQPEPGDAKREIGIAGRSHGLTKRKPSKKGQASNQATENRPNQVETMQANSQNRSESMKKRLPKSEDEEAEDLL
ncbi:MAG: hypothetical protein L6Q78_07925, partial [Bacteroidia bacterium]|nr:hypothetical protein [Bacteroidia bacterium]